MTHLYFAFIINNWLKELIITTSLYTVWLYSTLRSISIWIVTQISSKIPMYIVLYIVHLCSVEMCHWKKMTPNIWPIFNEQQRDLHLHLFVTYLCIIIEIWMYARAGSDKEWYRLTCKCHAIFSIFTVPKFFNRV